MLLLLPCTHVAAVWCLRYIEYESKLDALRAHRRQALGLEGVFVVWTPCTARHFQF